MKQQKIHHSQGEALVVEWLFSGLPQKEQKRICAQHNASLKNGNDIILDALALSGENIPDDVIHSECVTDTEVHLEDDD